MKKVYIDNVLVETEKLSSIQVKKQKKDIKEFSKKKTSFSKPIKVLQTSSNHKLFGNLFNINEVNGWDKNSRPLARIEVNSEVILNGKCKLDSVDKKHYNIIVYKEETNLASLFDDKLIRGNEDSSDDIAFLNKYNIASLTRDWMRANILNSAPRVDGLGIQYAHVSFGEDLYDSYLDDEYIAPTLGVREILEEILRSKGKTITFSSDILAYLNHMRIPFNGDYKELAKSWKYAKYNLTKNNVEEVNTFAPPTYLYEDWLCEYDYKQDISKETTTTRPSLELLGRGIYTLRINIKHFNNESNEYLPKVTIVDLTEKPYVTSELELNREDETLGDFTEKLFTATFESKSKQVSVYIGDDDITAKLSTDTFIEIVKDDSLYSGLTSINADKILPYNYKKVDLFNDVVNIFNATVEEDGNNLHLKTFREFNISGSSNKNWSDKIDLKSVNLSTLTSKQNTIIQYKFKKANDLFSEDFTEQLDRNDGDLERSEANKKESTTQLNFSNTVCRPFNNNQIALIINKDGNFSTVHTPRILFVIEFNYLSKNTWGFDNRGGKNIGISHFPLLSNRFSDVVADPNNIVLSFNLTHAYDENVLQATGYNLFNKFHNQEEAQYSHENLMFLRCKANLSAKDLADINFNDNIYVDLGKNGAGYYRVNTISYSSDENKLSILELIQINTEDINIAITESTITLESLSLLQSSGYKKNEIQSIIGDLGTVSGGGVSASTVALMIQEGIKDKLDKTGKAADSELLDGHDSGYFIHDDSNYAKLDTENTFTENQTIEKNLTIKGNFEVDGNFITKNTTDLAISDNLIELNKGESGAGVSAKYAGIELDRGSLINKGFIWDESDKLFKLGDFETHGGVILSATDTSHIRLLSNKTTNYIGKEIKFFKASEIALHSTIIAHNSFTHEITVSPALSKIIDSSWSWRVLSTENLNTIMVNSGLIGNNNGVVWDSAEKTFKDAGYKWALKNGDATQDFSSKILFANEYVRAGDRDIGAYTYMFSDRVFAFKNGNYTDLGLNNDKTILANVDGTLESKGLHSKEFISGILGKGFNFAANSEMDNLAVREGFTCNTFINNKINIQNGDMIVSDSAKITFIGSGTIYTKDRPFEIGEKLRCQQLSEDKTTLSVYYLIVVALGSNPTYGKYFTYTKTGSGEPKIDDLLVRWSGGLLYLNSSDPINGAYLDVAQDGVTKTRIGNLSGINDSVLGQLSGQGIYTDNGYFRGSIVANNGFIGNWNIDTNSIYSTKASGKIELTNDSAYPRIRVSKDGNNLIQTYYLSENEWGIQGVGKGKNMFQLGSTNKIAAWTFDDTKFYHGSASPLATGFMPNATDMYFQNGAFRTHKTYIENGIIHAIDGQFSGKVTSSEGDIAGFALSGAEGSGDLAVFGKMTAPNDKFELRSAEYNSGLKLKCDFSNASAGTTEFKNANIYLWTPDNGFGNHGVIYHSIKNTDGYASKGLIHGRELSLEIASDNELMLTGDIVNIGQGDSMDGLKANPAISVANNQIFLAKPLVSATTIKGAELHASNGVTTNITIQGKHDGGGWANFRYVIVDGIIISETAV